MDAFARGTFIVSTEVQLSCRRSTKSVDVITTARGNKFFRILHRKNVSNGVKPGNHGCHRIEALRLVQWPDDEAHFWLNDYVNKQNCRIWSEANPQVYVETPLHPEKLTVWCALWAGGILLQKQ
ncbi:hypothetical protein TNCV_2319701 [Trichonephila clavipes]|nr:hypothetical protein TNCV_2319701 [Trichonephila clavipes]